MATLGIKINPIVAAAQYIPPKPGPIIDLESGKTLGRHLGLYSYTVGQNARIRGMPQKMFVAKKDPKENVIYVVPGSCVQFSHVEYIFGDLRR